MANRDLISDNGLGFLVCAMDGDIILDIRMVSNSDGINVSTDDGIEPYGAIMAYFNVSDEGCVGRDPCGFADM